MRLEQIVIQGFKSFAERTEVQVFPGVTCIVGPNGCGKSNVADAIRWALGEQSPKTLRGQKMEDVIFHGSSSRRAVGLAEVGLVFNNDGGLNVPWSEVGVARRLYRTGESEYLLNKGVCRLRDIQDLFAGTGVNPKAYALMDQDRLNHVLTAKPWERRVFIEEAAGIARYKQQRAETQGKLEATRQNLQRVRDVMEEVRRQLGSIERQARKAQQYKALHAERQALDLALLAADCASLTALAGTLAREMNELRDAEEQRRARGASLTGRLALQSAGIQDTEYRLGDMRQSVQKIQGEAERLLERRPISPVRAGSFGSAASISIGAASGSRARPRQPGARPSSSRERARGWRRRAGRPAPSCPCSRLSSNGGRRRERSARSAGRRRRKLWRSFGWPSRRGSRRSRHWSGSRGSARATARVYEPSSRRPPPRSCGAWSARWPTCSKCHRGSKEPWKQI